MATDEKEPLKTDFVTASGKVFPKTKDFLIWFFGEPLPCYPRLTPFLHVAVFGKTGYRRCIEYLTKEAND